MSWKKTLTKLVEYPELHGRFLNTLSLMEYIGARKIVKSQHEKHITGKVLAHMAEEIRHAQTFKRLALKMDPSLQTYGESHLLASSPGRAYLQIVDRSVEKALGDSKPWENYLLSTLIIEERANSVYPFYARLLEPLGMAGPIKTILREEENHLQEIQTELKKTESLDNQALDEVRAAESQAFLNIIDEVHKSIGSVLA